jgi:hypothetical protein
VLDAVRKVAEGRGVPIGQVAIAWVLARPAVSSVILGARTLGQLDGNLAAADLALSQEETTLLDEASDLGAPDYRTANAVRPSAIAASEEADSESVGGDGPGAALVRAGTVFYIPNGWSRLSFAYRLPPL